MKMEALAETSVLDPVRPSVDNPRPLREEPRCADEYRPGRHTWASCLQVPPSLRPATWLLHLSGLAFISTAVGVEFILLGCLLSLPVKRDISELTGIGIGQYRPEYDMRYYALGCFLTVILTAIFVLRGNWQLGKHSPDAANRSACFYGRLRWIAGLTFLAGFLVLYLRFRQQCTAEQPLPGGPRTTLVAFFILTLLSAFLVELKRFGRQTSPESNSRPVSSCPSTLGRESSYHFFLPAPLRASAWALHVFSAILLGVSAGIQLLMLARLLVLSPTGDLVLNRQSEIDFLQRLLTSDFLAGLYAGTFILLTAACLAIAHRHLRDLSARDADEAARDDGLTRIKIAAVGLAVFFILYGFVRHCFVRVVLLPSVRATFVSAILLAMPLFFTVVGSFRPGWPTWLCGLAPARREARRKHRLGLLDFLPLLGLLILVYTPDVSALAGKLAWDHFHHWDYFVMGPALAVRHGMILGTQVYSQYGLGWPFLAGRLSQLIPLTYGNLVTVAVIYACLYFCGLYWAIRLYTRSAAWAALGTFIALFLQHFSGIGINEVHWILPSGTILRSPVDVWCLIALILHQRTQKPAFALAAAGLTALALVMATDTGIYLALALTGYWVTLWLQSFRGPGNRYGRTTLRLATISAATAAIVLFVSLLIISQGTCLQARFWVGWLEPILRYGGGFGQLPLATYPKNPALLLFVLVMGVYLLAAAFVAIRLLLRTARREDALLGLLASYGMLYLLYFVGRSHQFNVYCASVPFSLLLVLGGFRLRRTLDAILRQSLSDAYARRTALGLTSVSSSILAAMLCVLVFRGSEFGNYPNLVHCIMFGTPNRMETYFDPALGIRVPRSQRPFCDMYHAGATRIRELRAAGKSVAIIDNWDAGYYLVADSAPWSRYTPLLPGIYRAADRQELLSDLTARAQYVLVTREQLRAETIFKWDQRDTWSELDKFLEGSYEPEGEAGPFNVWRVADFNPRTSQAASSRAPGALSVVR